MPTYMITDNVTGRKFKVTGDSPPTETEAMQIFKDMGGSAKPDNYDLATTDPAKYEELRRAFVDQTGTLTERVKDRLPSRKTVAAFARPALEGAGAVLGGIVGGTGGGLAGLAGGPAAPGTVPYGAIAGGVAGAGLGYAGGKNIADMIEGDTPKGLAEAVNRSLRDVGTGAALEMGGLAIGPALGMAAKGAGKVAKPLLGKLSGVGTGAVDEAIKSGAKSTGMNPLASTTAFDKALRGKISGEEIVDNARGALNTLKQQRSDAYQAKLAQVEANKGPIDTFPVISDMISLMDRYKVKLSSNGNIDTSRVPMGAKGRKDIEEVITQIAGWGKQPGDNTAMGLDTLKRQLDDFYSDSSQARQFVAEMRNKVRDAIVKHVPEYDEMTKGYSEATKLIKDVEADLMMRKQGMSGRITADKTLRRLTSAMRENFEMRRELVDILGAKGNEDLSGQIAGYTMNTTIPRGLAGTGPVLAGQAAYAQFVNPSFWPVLAASSPRVQGEFLRMFGKGMNAAQKHVGKAGARAAGMQAVISSNGDDDSTTK